MLLDAEDPFQGLLDHDGEAEGDQDLVGMRPVVEEPDQAALHGEADGEQDERGR